MVSRSISLVFTTKITMMIAAISVKLKREIVVAAAAKRRIVVDSFRIFSHMTENTTLLISSNQSL
jgi:hypothetical protein